MNPNEDLQSFLEQCLQNVAELTPEIIQAKKQEYRKLYLSQYRKKYWEKYIQISFRLTKKEYAKFSKIAALNNEKVTSIIKQSALHSLNYQAKNTTQRIKIPILSLRDEIEEHLEEGIPVNISSIVQQIDTVLELLE